MKKGMKIKIFLIMLLSQFCSCDGIYNKHILGNFYLTACDTIHELCLSYYDSVSKCYPIIVDCGVYDVRYNKEYIIVKRHPFLKPDSRLEYNEDVTEFYIVKVVHTTYFGDENCLGPFTEEEFVTKEKELNVGKLLEFPF
ncbi:DUF3997 domain-containing protein [Bacteroides helcogenes]|nr:DUF3997 domain-containing protein [Bacteroides helcogenes]MDY5238916.1 DUF3997 domain-containing protein [Bacteroides helcogenes]